MSEKESIFTEIPQEIPKQIQEKMDDEKKQEFVKKAKEDEKAKLEEQLGIEITDDDIDTYLFKGYIEKDFKEHDGKIMFTLATLKIGERNVIEDFLGKLIGETTTQRAFALYRDQYTMAFALKKFQGKNTGNNLEERLEFIKNNIGDVLFDLLSTRFNQLITLVSLAITEDAIKKG